MSGFPWAKKGKAFCVECQGIGAPCPKGKKTISPSKTKAAEPLQGDLLNVLNPAERARHIPKPQLTFPGVNGNLLGKGSTGQVRLCGKAHLGHNRPSGSSRPLRNLQDLGGGAAPKKKRKKHFGHADAGRCLHRRQ